MRVRQDKLRAWTYLPRLPTKGAGSVTTAAPIPEGASEASLAAEKLLANSSLFIGRLNSMLFLIGFILTPYEYLRRHRQAQYRFPASLRHSQLPQMCCVAPSDRAFPTKSHATGRERAHWTAHLGIMIM